MENRIIPNLRKRIFYKRRLQKIRAKAKIRNNFCFLSLENLISKNKNFSLLSTKKNKSRLQFKMYTYKNTKVSKFILFLN
jgi:hypothetical protein